MKDAVTGIVWGVLLSVVAVGFGAWAGKALHEWRAQEDEIVAAPEGVTVVVEVKTGAVAIAILAGSLLIARALPSTSGDDRRDEQGRPLDG